MLTQLTLRGLDSKLERSLRSEAKRHDISLNKAALNLMRRGAGLDRPEEAQTVGSSLDDFIGVWSREEEQEFLNAIEMFGQIDAELWE